MALTPFACSAADWPRATLEEAGLAPGLAGSLDTAVREGRFENLHAVLVARGGRLVLERYYEGEDELWGQPLGRVAFGPATLHDLRSVTKSVVGLLYGIALAEGAAPPVEAPLLDQFPEYADLAAEPERGRMTVRDALAMTLGTAWDESLSYADPRNSEHAMELAPDRVRYVLEQPVVAEPGSRWIYNGGATALLARLIERGSGRTLRAFAEDRLLGLLGIRTLEWVRGADGAHLAASGLRLRPRDLARLGQLVLDGGSAGGRQIVPRAWLAESFRPHADAGGLAYGYHWWLGPAGPGGPLWVAAFGNGGQRLYINPALDLLVVVTAGNYNRPNDWKLPVAVITEMVLPALKRR
ncbi:serine hydrolase [Geminicoccaceae bacterium 1502E]|nr:serine hydrolase [Geminicoccaceae bacterium 1502E]